MESEINYCLLSIETASLC